jgi:LacI family transcriptional regulator
MPRRPNVALLIETSNAYARGLLHGIRAFMREHGPWSIYLGEQRRGEEAPSWLRNWTGDGVIARIENRQIARVLRAAKVPIVDVSAGRYLPTVPYVETDDRAIAELAAMHLLDRGFRHFAFFGDNRFRWSKLRQTAFVDTLAERGLTCEVFSPPNFRPGAFAWEQEKRAIGRWIVSLPKPAGVMAAYDIRGRQFLDICREAGIAVPDELAVIGVDNDELLCDLSDPPLSSVTPDAHRTGYEAAMLLDRMMTHRGKRSPDVRLIAPQGVVTRRSTDVLALDDREIAAALRFIREHATQSIKVGDVLRVVPLSRRIFESRFERAVGRTPHEEIVRVQLDGVKQLLLQTDLPISVVAERAGYKHIEYMTVAFTRSVGVSPSRWRREHRIAGGPRSSAAMSERGVRRKRS